MFANDRWQIILLHLNNLGDGSEELVFGIIYNNNNGITELHYYFFPSISDTFLFFLQEKKKKVWPWFHNLESSLWIPVMPDALSNNAGDGRPVFDTLRRMTHITSYNVAVVSSQLGRDAIQKWLSRSRLS